MGRREEEGYGPIDKIFTNPFVKVLLVPLGITIVSIIGTAIISKHYDYKAVVQNMSERFFIG